MDSRHIAYKSDVQTEYGWQLSAEIIAALRLIENDSDVLKGLGGSLQESSSIDNDRSFSRDVTRFVRNLIATSLHNEGYDAPRRGTTFEDLDSELGWIVAARSGVEDAAHLQRIQDRIREQIEIEGTPDPEEIDPQAAKEIRNMLIVLLTDVGLTVDLCDSHKTRGS